MARTERLDADEATAKAAECRDDAKRAKLSEHKIILEHMAQTWERIASNRPMSAFGGKADIETWVPKSAFDPKRTSLAPKGIAKIDIVTR